MMVSPSSVGSPAGARSCQDTGTQGNWKFAAPVPRGSGGGAPALRYLPTPSTGSLLLMEVRYYLQVPSHQVPR
jgi:hypothetical protein